MKKSKNYNVLEKQNTIINLNALEKYLNSVAELQLYIKSDKVALFKTCKRKFLFNIQNIYIILNLDEYDEKTINKQIAIMIDKYEKKYGFYEDFENEKVFILLVISKWDETAENFINSEDFGNEYGLWTSSKFYLIYNNKIYYQANSQNSIRNEKKYNKVIENILKQLK